MENKREYIYDFLRVLSCFLIIGIHCVERLLHGDTYNLIWWECNISNAIVRSGLLLFVFISGALLLNKKPEKASDFYLKRFVKIIIPFLVYSYMYLWIDKYHFSFEIFLPNVFFESFIKIISSPVSYHFWFVYMIIGIYLFVPYLRKMMQNLTDTECRNLFILLYCVSFIKYLLPSFGMKLGISNLLIIEWLIPFVLGYLMTRSCINSHYKIIYVCGILSFIFLIIAKRYFPNINHLYDLAPTMLMQCQAIFLFFIRNKKQICSNALMNKFVSFISNYCYEIYLIHALILDILLRYLFCNVLIISPFISTIIAIVLVFVLSFLCTFIINNLLVKNLMKLFNYIVNLIKSLYSRLHV